MLACHAVTCAQEPIASMDRELLPTVEERLASDSAADVAWGGYLAQRYRLRGATRAICEALARLRGRDELEARFTRLHLLDGLIGSGAKVPAEQVEHLLDDPLTRAAAFAVIATDPKANREALTRVAVAPAERGDLVRKAAGRMLVTRELQAPPLGELIVKHAEVHLRVTLRDDKTEECVHEGQVGLGGMVKRRPRSGRLDGFPPLIRLRLTTSLLSDDIVALVVAERLGVPAVLLTRDEGVTYASTDLQRGELQAAPSNDELLLLLAATTRARPSQYTHLRITWQDADAFAKLYTTYRDGVSLELDAAVEELRQRGWLRRDALVGQRIALHEHLDDVRGDKSVPLPELPRRPEPNR